MHARNRLLGLDFGYWSMMDSIHRMELIVALLEQHLEVPLVRRFERGSVLQPWLTPWQLQV